MARPRKIPTLLTVRAGCGEFDRIKTGVVDHFQVYPLVIGLKRRNPFILFIFNSDHEKGSR